MNIVLTNDDGIDAPGLAALEAACRRALPDACRLVVVAPKEPHSGCGHRVTTDRPLVLERVGPDRFHVDGTPADCVRLALHALFSGDEPPLDWVFSGINAGGNLGVDIHHSGTVAAAREATLHGVRSLAASHYHRRESPIDWERASRWMAEILAAVVGREGAAGEPLNGAQPLGAGEFWNVNFPHPLEPVEFPAIIECAIDPSPLPIGYDQADEGWRYRSRYHERPRLPGGDVDTCFSGRIAVSRGRVV
ncbi:MAG: 5'/3'-nucleotidase SurE [Planctomycetia bacterium]|jgi:5'-nucleotidase